jgi:hypothetical protein
MKVEHIGLIVKYPIDMGKWYVENLGFKMLRCIGDNQHGASFIQDPEGNTVIEFGSLPESKPLDFHAFDPVQIHLAIECENPIQEAERLAKVGGNYLGECSGNEYPGEKVFVRDPWGLSIQLLNRKVKLY